MCLEPRLWAPKPFSHKRNQGSLGQCLIMPDFRYGVGVEEEGTEADTSESKEVIISVRFRSQSQRDPIIIQWRQFKHQWKSLICLQDISTHFTWQDTYKTVTTVSWRMQKPTILKTGKGEKIIFPITTILWERLSL